MKYNRNLIAAIWTAVGALWFGQAALADDDVRIVTVPVLPKYKAECGACHTAYSPGLLPAASWRHVMGNLTHHFGADASLDAATTQELLVWLTKYSTVDRRVREEPPQDRITRSPWFLRAHDEISTATWSSAAVRRAGNCAACHPRAEQGDFNERSARIPR